MKLTYATKYNGKFYNAGEEIPVENNKVVEEKNEIEEEVIEKPIEKVEEVTEKPKRTKKK